LSFWQVNADKYGDLGSRFDVKGFPTILYFPRGKPAIEHTTCASSPQGRARCSCCRLRTAVDAARPMQPQD